METRPRNNGGFTLIELIVALFVIGVISFISTDVWFTIMDNWEATSTRARLETAADNVFDEMRADFDCLLAPSLAGASISGVSTEAEAGEPSLALDSLTLPVERLNVLTGLREASLVTYRIVRPTGDDDNEPAGDPVLQRVVRPLDAPENKGRPQTILTGASAMQIQYFNGTRWLADWKAKTLPELVRVSLLVLPEAEDARAHGEAIGRVADFGIHVQ